ncbi:MAG TPA: SUMF1/EgtB/PvdO family nonheme iron enzyme, partial [Myxococcota bacterium]
LLQTNPGSPSKQSPEKLAEAARRLLAAGSQPEDTLDEGTGSELDTAPRGAPVPKEIVPEARAGLLSSRKIPHDPDELGAAFAPELDDAALDDDGMLPPPLPGDDTKDATIPRSMKRRSVPDMSTVGVDQPSEPSAGDDAVNESGEEDPRSEEGPTDEHPHLSRATGKDSGKKDSAIHDALTALKPHPADLMDEGPRRAHEERLEKERLDKEAGARQQPFKTGDMRHEKTDKVRERGRQSTPRPPPIDDVDNDSLQETLSADVLRAAKERSSPSLHRAEPLSPPVIAPPPVLRPVSPPRRRGNNSPGPLAFILGVVLVAAAVVVWRFLVPHDDKKQTTPDNDHALVTTHNPPDLTNPTAIVPVPAVDAGTAVAVAPDTSNPVKPPDAAHPSAVDAGVAKIDSSVDAGTAPVVIALAAGACPKAMAPVAGGTFIAGSDGSDPMRNFGEAAAASADVKPYCIDYYESPNGKDATPTVGVTWQGAKNACEKAGKRLCTEKEWERACKGPSSSRFPYGNTYDADTCNTEDASGKARALAPATSFKKCRSGFKVFEMAGNAEEWVADAVAGKRITKGGSADRPDFSSRCAARRVPDGANLGMVGYRCCADPK